mgnify:CR=1 FL=1
MSMRFFSDISITKKLVSLMLITSVVSLLLASGMQVVSEAGAYRSNIVDNLTTVADVVAANSAAAVTFEDQVQAAEVCSNSTG